RTPVHCLHLFSPLSPDCTIPEYIQHIAQVLDMSYNQISVIKKNDFVHLFNLQNLNVSNNQIKEVDDGAFRDLTTLQELNLACNKLNSVTKGFFWNLFNLTVLVMLNVSGNYLYDIYKIQMLLQTFNSTLVKLNIYYLGEQTVKTLFKPVCLISSLRTDK
uniref:Uncharacterized protein n=1 Tax=Electrophorus electricus TaxID=8005 RepID=A0AAY5E8J5_ELEEL